MLEVIGGVGGISAIPVSEDVFGRQGYASAHLDIVRDTLLVVMSISQEVPVCGIGVYGVFPPHEPFLVGLECIGGTAVLPGGLRTFVYDGPSSSGDKSFLQSVSHVVSPSCIQGAVCTQQVQSIILPRIPFTGESVHLEGDEQVVGILVRLFRYRSKFVSQVDTVGVDIEIGIIILSGEVWHRQFAVDDGKGGSVLKLCRGTVLDAYHAVREDCEAYIACCDHSLGMGHGVHLLSISLESGYA